MSQTLTAMDVIEFLSQGQVQLHGQLIAASKSYWEPNKEGPAFFAFVIELSLNRDKIDWKTLFIAIESVLKDPLYANYSDQVATHILEGLSNKVANGNLAPEILTKNAGPLAQDHMKKWELAMSKKTIF